MREIVIDTETTGLEPQQGHRLIEVGCVELVNRMPTGKFFHCYLNPERDVPLEAVEIHGLSAEVLADKPRFAEIVDELLAFLGEAPLVAHNAMFDLSFLNAELERSGRQALSYTRLIDTLLLARRKHPAMPNRLDDLCARYAIDLSRRTKHGALLDAELLAEVYLELIDARQAQLVLHSPRMGLGMPYTEAPPIRLRTHALPPLLTESEREAHLGFVATLGEQAIWRDYLSAAAPLPTAGT
jgi:DNA polymerase III subunit epsilon